MIDAKELRELESRMTPEPWDEENIYDLASFWGQLGIENKEGVLAMRNSLIPLLDRLEKLEAFREAYDYWDREAFYPFKDTFFKPGIKLKEARAALDQKEG